MAPAPPLIRLRYPCSFCLLFKPTIFNHFQIDSNFILLNFPTATKRLPNRRIREVFIVGDITNPDTGLSYWASLAPFFLSAQLRFFHRGGDPSRTQLRDPGDELYRNRFGEWKMDCPLSQFIAHEVI